MMKKINMRGLTIIELIIVIAVIATVIPAIFTLFLSTLQVRSKIYRIQETKKTGDYIFNVIQQTIKDRAISIHTDPTLTDLTEVCSTKSSVNTPASYTAPVGQNIYFKDKNGILFYYTTYSNVANNIARVASYSAALNTNTIFLSSAQVSAVIFTGSVKCFRTSNFSTPIIEISFNISTRLTFSLPRHEELDLLRYTIKVKLRN